MQRSSLFSLLKPPCVALSEAALAFEAQPGPTAPLLPRLRDLSALLDSLQQDGQASGIDGKLAEYVFFPLSHVLRQRDALPATALELALKCLLVLLQTGWHGHLHAEFATQLVILLTFLANASPEQPNRHTTDDLRVLAFRCLSSVFHSMTASSASIHAFTSLSNVPALGHAITTLLDAIKATESGPVALAALHVLTTFVDRINGRDVLSSFLPGIVSSLTQALTPSTKTRRPYRLLEGSLDVLTRLLRAVFSDQYSFPIKHDSSSATDDPAFVPRLDQSWLAANAAQVKLALANVVRLRKHDRIEVRDALRRLSLAVVRDCPVHLADSLPMMLDTLIVLAQREDAASLHSELQVVISSNNVILDSIRSGLYDRFLSLPRTILSNDSAEKDRTAGHIKTSFQLLISANEGFGSLSGPVLSSIRDALGSVLSSTSANAAQSFISDHDASPSSLALASAAPPPPQTRWPAVLATSAGDAENAALLTDITKCVSTSTMGLGFVRESLDQLPVDEPNTRLANIWISLNILRWQHESLPSIDELLDVDLASEQELELRDELYAAAVSLLNDSLDGDSLDWRTQSLAMEAVAFQAATLGPEFRPELADVLFPVLHLLGSGTEQLRRHAIVCLNALAKSCKYSHVQEMIISNVDYLVNGVSVRLNTFDLSPEIPQVLLMLIKLNGPALLPYLDDVTDNIFEALEQFHGYPALVEILFAVLKGMVEEGAKAPALTIEAPDETRAFAGQANGTEPTSMPALTSTLRDRAAKRKRKNEDLVDDRLPDRLPRKPWKDLRAPSKEADQTASSADRNPDEDDDDNPPDTTEKPPPLSKTYALLHRITLLTQHHLPSSSSAIRASLLSLLATSIPHLAAHEDTLLPTVHSLWPVLVARLADREAFVVAGVLDVMEAMCRGARGFLRGRVADVWPAVKRLHAGLAGDTASSGAPTKTLAPRVTAADVAAIVKRPDETAQAGLTAVSTRRTGAAAPEYAPEYTPTTTVMVRNALTRFLVSLVRHVRVQPRMFSEILSGMLWHALVVDRRRDVRAALECANKDAVWLTFARDSRSQVDTAA